MANPFLDASIFEDCFVEAANVQLFAGHLPIIQEQLEDKKKPLQAVGNQEGWLKGEVLPRLCRLLEKCNVMLEGHFQSFAELVSEVQQHFSH